MKHRALFVLLLLAVSTVDARASNSTPPPDRCGGSSAYTIPVDGAPFAVVATPDAQHLFVSLNSSNPRQVNGLAILACGGGRYRRQSFLPLENQPTGMALTHAGDLLVVADDTDVAFVDVNRALSGKGDPLLGFFEDLPGDDGGAVYANISPDDRFAFVSEEQSGTITVIDLMKARSNHFSSTSVVGEIQLGRAPVALVFSKDGRHLFTTVQVAPDAFGFQKTCKTEGAPAAEAKDESPGALIVIDVATAETDPAHAVISKVPAACHPVRAALAPDGDALWVTARASNMVLKFSTARLIAGDAQANLAQVPVGAAPVPVIVTSDGKYVLSGNSDRFAQGAPQDQDLDVIDAQSAAVVGHIRVGKFPRELSRSRSGATIFLSNFLSNSITVIEASAIPQVMTRQ